MRRLAFEGTEGQSRWDILYGAMLVNPEGYAKEARRVARHVLEKLESIAKPVEDQTLLAKFQYDGEEPRELVFEEGEFTLLKDTVDKIPWTRSSVVMADKVMDWLETLQREK